jgi:hypothetical protein
MKTCGAGWAFAAAGLMEMMTAKAYKDKHISDDFEWKADMGENVGTNAVSA